MESTTASAQQPEADLGNPLPRQGFRRAEPTGSSVQVGLSGLRSSALWCHSWRAPRLHSWGTPAQTVRLESAFSPEFQKGDGGGHTWYSERHQSILSPHSYCVAPRGPARGLWSPGCTGKPPVGAGGSSAPQGAQQQVLILAGPPRGWLSSSQMTAEQAMQRNASTHGFPGQAGGTGQPS